MCISSKHEEEVQQVVLAINISRESYENKEVFLRMTNGFVEVLLEFTLIHVSRSFSVMLSCRLLLVIH